MESGGLALNATMPPT